MQIEWTGLGLLFHLSEPFAFLKRWRASVGRHGHGEALWGTCISVLMLLEISVVDIGRSINGNACILARGVSLTWDLLTPPPSSRLCLGVLEDNSAKNCTAFVNVCCLGCVCFARGRRFPDFVDLESRMVFIPLLNYVMRGIFLNFCVAPFPGSLGFFASSVLFYLYTFERASGDSCSRE